MKKRILIFTDSRGQRKGTFSSELIFTEKIKQYFEKKNIKVDLMLCPYRWTTTIDFIQCIEENIISISEYDVIILYTGIVEYSPRPISNFKEALNGGDEDVTRKKLQKSKVKMVNNKERFMKKWIGEDLLRKNTEYDTKYKNEFTKSLISLEIYKKKIIPYLQTFDKKLLFINSNRIVKNWDGNYKKKNPYGRPKNIHVIEDFSKETIHSFSNCINLFSWSDDEIKKYTVDNMHLTLEGSNYIFHQIINNKMFDIYRNER